MKKLSFQLLLAALMALSLAVACVSCSSEDDEQETLQTLEMSQIVGCWKVPVSDTVTEYWQFSTAAASELQPRSRAVSIDTPSGTYINTRITENPQNHTRVMELLAYGAYMVDKLNHEIRMSHGSSSDYSTNFKVILIDDQMTLESEISSESPLVLVNVHRVDSEDHDYASPLSAGTCFSFGGYEISVNGEYCTFLKHPLYKGYESRLDYYNDYGDGDIENAGKVSFEKTGKNSAKITVYTREWVENEPVFYGFDPVEIAANLQFWGDGYGIVSGGRVIRKGKYITQDRYEYIEEETALGRGSFGEI